MAREWPAETCLQFLFLQFQSADHLLHLVHRPTSFAQLISQVLDFQGQRFVLAAQGLQLFVDLILAVLQFVDFGTQAAVLALGSVQFSRQVVDLLPPFIDDLVEALLLLLQGLSDTVSLKAASYKSSTTNTAIVSPYPFNIDLGIVKLSQQLMARLLQASDLDISLLQLLLVFLRFVTQLTPKKNLKMVVG